MYKDIAYTNRDDIYITSIGTTWLDKIMHKHFFHELYSIYLRQHLAWYVGIQVTVQKSWQNI